MPLPMPRTPGGLSPATADLGLGTMLADQVAGETEEQRRKRMQEAQQQRGFGGSPAVMSLFGTGGAGGTTY